MSEPISLFVPVALIALLAVPLALRLVPPNRIYGFRTARSLASPELWFRINRFAGFALIAAAAATAGIYLAAPQLASGRSFQGMLALIVPVISALVAASVYARRAAGRD